MTAKPKSRLIGVDLDNTIAPAFSADAEHEREVAIYDLIEDNLFAVSGRDHGPYRLKLSIADNRLIFDVRTDEQEPVQAFGLSLSPFRRIVKDYFIVCESYYKAIRNATPSQIETIDMARRALHNEGSALLKERLDGKIEADLDTARRLFTLLCALHWRH